MTEFAILDCHTSIFPDFQQSGFSISLKTPLILRILSPFTRYWAIQFHSCQSAQFGRCLYRSL